MTIPKYVIYDLREQVEAILNDLQPFRGYTPDFVYGQQQAYTNVLGIIDVIVDKIKSQCYNDD
jgi:hypothetical protein